MEGIVKSMKRCYLRKEIGRIDWIVTLLPLVVIIALSVLFFFIPEQSNVVLGQIRYVLGDTFGVYYLIVGVGVFFCQYI